MTFTTESLRELLASQSAESLAKEFTDALNNALEQIAADEKAKAAAENKTKDTQLLLDHFKTYLETHYPQFPIEMIRFDAEIFETAFDSTFGDRQFIKDVQTMSEAAKVLTRSTHIGLDNTIKPKTEDPLTAFLKSHGL